MINLKACARCGGDLIPEWETPSASSPRGSRLRREVQAARRCEGRAAATGRVGRMPYAVLGVAGAEVRWPHCRQTRSPSLNKKTF